MRQADRRFMVSGADSRLANGIATHLKKMGLPGSVCKFASLPGRLSPGRDGLLVLAASSAADAPEVVRLVQEIRLQQWPVTLVVAATEPAAGALSGLGGFIERLIAWPWEAGALAGLLRERLPGGLRPKAAPEPSAVEVICREFLGATPALWRLGEHLAVAAAHDIPVLITGETGTGKSFLARVLHENSPRKDHGFLVVPCGALMPHLIESELFGHVRGAFTGADRDRKGRFSAAGKGTLFLDEIDSLGLEQQANLLRVIETGEFEAVGSTQTQVCAARIIAASSGNLEEAVASGKFRQDLYYRLAGMAFQLPPLRERPGDIPLLVRGLVARFNRKFNKGLFDIDPEVLAALQVQPWVGNIRELENRLLQAVLHSSGAMLRVEHLPPFLRPNRPPGCP
jgi:DNA-binding NtrC family response regulator